MRTPHGCGPTCRRGSRPLPRSGRTRLRESRPRPRLPRPSGMCIPAPGRRWLPATARRRLPARNRTRPCHRPLLRPLRLSPARSRGGGSGQRRPCRRRSPGMAGTTRVRSRRIRRGSPPVRPHRSQTPSSLQGRSRTRTPGRPRPVSLPRRPESRAARQSAAGQPAAGQPRATGKTRTGGKLPGETLPGGDAEAGGPRPAPASAGRPVPPPGQPPSAPGRLSFPPGRPSSPPGRPVPPAGRSMPPGERPEATSDAGRPEAPAPSVFDPARAPDPPHRLPPAPAVRVGAHRAESSPTAVRGGTGEHPGPARGHWTGGGAPGSEADAGPPVTDDTVARGDTRGARPGAPATARPDSPSEPRLTSHEPARRPRAGSGTGGALTRSGEHTRAPAPDSGGTEELTVDIELLEIVEREPQSRTPPARRPPVSLSDYLTRRAR